MRDGHSKPQARGTGLVLLGGAVLAGFAIGCRDRRRADVPDARQVIGSSVPGMAAELLGRALADAIHPGIEVLCQQPPNDSAPDNRSITTATDDSWQTGAGRQALGFDSPPITSNDLSNPEVAGVAHAGPYYPPGSAPDDQSLRPHRAVGGGERSASS